ncbi:MAG: helix-turn-helix domain-containing protein [Solirubrobacteraceae bacterium]
MALNADLHQRWVSNVENGKRNPSYGSLRRLAAGLDLSVAELVALAEALKLETQTKTAPPRLSGAEPPA